MKADERRKEIVSIIMSESEPVSGSVLSERLNVSRQIIVQDITMLKAAGFDIISTHKGYVLKENPYAERVFKLKHTSEQTEDELMSIVGLGGMVMDVFVWHRVYGRIDAKLNIFTEKNVQEFMEGIKTGRSSELMHITSGYHYHTVRAESEKILDDIENVLKEKGYWLEAE
ncbi:MAG: transcription repressor NadR [Lachnospiraceae bacterium]|nr:transcription repressor NadR [Lachnospiraceae bacterium]